MKKYRGYKKGVAFTWLLSYIFILAIPLITTGLLFIGIRKIVTDKITEMNEGILFQIKGSLDHMFEAIYKNSLEIETSAELAGVLGTGGEIKTDDYYRFYVLNQYIKRCTTYSDYIEDVLIFLDTSGYCISSKSSYESSMFEVMFKQYGLEDKDLIYLREKKERGFYILEREGQEGRCVYTVPLYDRGRIHESGRILVIPKQKYFNQKIGGNGKNMEKAVYLTIQERTMPLGTIPEWISEKRNLSSSLKSDVSKLQYVIVDRYSLVYRELEVLKILIFASIAVSLCMGTWCSLYFTRKNYVPMKELMSSVTGHLGVKKEQDINEYIFLSNAMTKVIQTKEEAECQLFLIRLLRGGAIPESVMKKMFTDDVYVVAAFAIEDTKDFFSEGDAIPDNHRLLSFIVSNCNKDFFGAAAGRFSVVELDRCLVQIICCSSGKEQEIRARVLKTLEEIHEFFNQKLKIKLSIALGGVCYRPEDIALSCEKAREALEYRIIMGNNVVIDSHELTELTLSYDYSIEDEKDIINSLIGGNFEQSKALVYKVIDSNLSSGMMSSQLAHCMLFDIAGTVMKALSLTRLDNNFLGQLNPVERLFRCETFEQMKAELSDILFCVCNYINQEREDPNRRLFENITAYIEKHYMECTLSVQSLADVSYVSKTFLLKLFKDYSGLTPLDYINRLRCERAALLLGSTEETVEEIAKCVGYSGAHSFIRVFKKIYGRTPGNYRMAVMNEMIEKGK